MLRWDRENYVPSVDARLRRFAIGVLSPLSLLVLLLLLLLLAHRGACEQVTKAIANRQKWRLSHAQLAS